MTEPALVIDAVGRMCPMPVIELARNINDVPVGALVEILSDDPAAATDIPAWCRMRDQEYAGSEARDAVTAYRVRRVH